jgi:hypothetical protein
VIELKGWKRAVPTPQDLKLGCIPWSFEFILRYHRIKGINFKTFQHYIGLVYSKRNCIIEPMWLQVSELVYRHEMWPGGHDIAHLSLTQEVFK